MHTRADTLVALLAHADELERAGIKLSPAQRETHIEKPRRLLLKQVSACITSGNSFLREMANAVSRHASKGTLADFVTAQIEAAQAFGQPLPSVSSLVREARVQNLISDRHSNAFVVVSRIFKNCGVNPPRNTERVRTPKKEIKVLFRRDGKRRGIFEVRKWNRLRRCWEILPRNEWPRLS